MGFDIRNYNSEGTPVNSEKEEFWTVKYLRHVDDYFPKINSECEALFNGISPKTADAFSNKISAWKGFVDNLQRLCSLYKIDNAKCLSRKS